MISGINYGISPLDYQILPTFFQQFNDDSTRVILKRVIFVMENVWTTPVSYSHLRFSDAEYPRTTKSVTLLSMLWLCLLSSGHQQPRYWINCVAFLLHTGLECSEWSLSTSTGSDRRRRSYRYNSSGGPENNLSRGLESKDYTLWRLPPGSKYFSIQLLFHQDGPDVVDDKFSIIVIEKFWFSKHEYIDKEIIFR